MTIVKICGQCGQSKPENDFPYQVNRVCLPCHRLNAMHWKELAWVQSGNRNLSEAKRFAIAKAAAVRKDDRTAGKSTTKTQEALRNGL
jgi:hypothetical protein